ncbi:Uncharacterised protein [Klebsiella pneumoniae]|nr:Uncharacterised protein [Klebsiella pneumoniae]
MENRGVRDFVLGYFDALDVDLEGIRFVVSRTSKH